MPHGEAAVRRPGKDVSLIAYGYMAQVCLEAATKAAAKGVEAEVIDLRTLVPLDEPTVLDSVKKTGRGCEGRSPPPRSEEHTSELQSQFHLVCRLLLEKKKKKL